MGQASLILLSINTGKDLISQERKKNWETSVSMSFPGKLDEIFYFNNNDSKLGETKMKKITRIIAIATVMTAVTVMSARISEAGPGKGFHTNLKNPQKHEMVQGKKFFASKVAQGMVHAQRIKDCKKLQAGHTDVWVTWDKVKKIWLCHSDFDHSIPMYR